MGNCLTFEGEKEAELEEIQRMSKALHNSLRGSKVGDRKAQPIAEVINAYSPEQLATLRTQLALGCPHATGLATGLLEAARADPAVNPAHPDALAALGAVAKLSADAFATQRMVSLGLRGTVTSHMGHPDPRIRLVTAVSLAFLVAYDAVSAQKVVGASGGGGGLASALVKLVRDAAAGPGIVDVLKGQPLEEAYRAIACVDAGRLAQEPNGEAGARHQLREPNHSTTAPQENVDSARAGVGGEGSTKMLQGGAQTLPVLVLVAALRNVRDVDGPRFVVLLTDMLKTCKLPRLLYGEIAAILDDRLLCRPANKVERATFAEQGGVDLLSDTSLYDWSRGIRSCTLMTQMLKEGHGGLAAKSQALFVRTAECLHHVVSQADAGEGEGGLGFSRSAALGRLLPALYTQGTLGVHAALANAERNNLEAALLTPCPAGPGPLGGKMNLLHMLVSDLWAVVTHNPTVSTQAAAVHALWAVAFGAPVAELHELVLRTGRESGGLAALLRALVTHMLYMHPSGGREVLDALLSVSQALHAKHLAMTVKDAELVEIEAQIAELAGPSESRMDDDGEDVARVADVDRNPSKHYDSMSASVASLARGAMLLFAHLSSAGPRAAAVLNESGLLPHLIAHLGDGALRSVDRITLSASLLCAYNLLSTAAAAGEPLAPQLVAAPLGDPAFNSVEHGDADVVDMSMLDTEEKGYQASCPSESSGSLCHTPVMPMPGSAPPSPMIKCVPLIESDAERALADEPSVDAAGCLRSRSQTGFGAHAPAPSGIGPGIELFLRVMREAADGDLATPRPYMALAARCIGACLDGEASVRERMLEALEERTGLGDEDAVRAMLAELMEGCDPHAPLSTEPFLKQLLPRNVAKLEEQQGLVSAAHEPVRHKWLAFRCNVQHQKLHEHKVEESTIRMIS